MKLCDSHVHFGATKNLTLSGKLLHETLERRGITRAIVSNIEACEFDSQGIFITERKAEDDIRIHQKTSALILKDFDRLRGLFWVMPHSFWETPNKSLSYIEELAPLYVGLKIHPWHSQMPLFDRRLQPWLQWAHQQRFPVVVHTAADSFSRPINIEQVAPLYPKVRFLLVHAGLGTDHQEAIAACQKYPNVYLDTTWVQPECIERMIDICGPSKVILGTDAPIGLLDSDILWEKTISFLQNHYSAHDFEAITWQNAMNFFAWEDD